LRADLSLLSEARRVVAEVDARLQKLDALILSAGSVEFIPATTSEGLDRTFVTNFLHKVVLAEGLKPRLAAAEGRLILVAADLPDTQEPDWANFEGKRSYAGLIGLPRLHSACLAMIQAWAADWKPERISVMAIHPGLVDTGFFRSAKGPWRILNLLLKVLASPPEKAAALLDWLAFAEEPRQFSGWLFRSPGNFAKRRPLSRAPQVLERVAMTAHGALN
jgi:NAD(P)-dependent dehydrogenase (short-subunit alcohol dehydrogenase family)